LRVINNYNTPKVIVDYIFKYKYEVIENAIKKAGINDLEETIKAEKNINILKLIYDRRSNSIFRVIDRLYDFQLLMFLDLEYLPVASYGFTLFFVLSIALFWRV
jgi:hypothetical protein